jgi:phage tail sheath protein FI
MGNYKAPGVYVERVSSGNKPIESAGTSTAAFIGEAHEGPLNQAVEVANWSQYTKYFGGFDKAPHLAHAVYQWFNNGGGLAFVSNVGKPEGDAPAADAKAKAGDKPAKAEKTKARPELFIGEDKGPGRRTGLNVFNSIDQIALVVAPGQTDPAIHGAVLDHCERMKDRFAILDCAEELDTGLSEMYKPRPSAYGAYYFPWIQVFDPVSKANKYVPPSGAVAGVYARCDSERGVHKAPANEIVRGALGLKYYLTGSEQELLNPRGINLIRDMGDRGIRVWGARTLSDDPEWRYINVQRLFLMVEQSIREGTQWTVFEPNDEKLWAAITRNIKAYLTNVWRSGALFGSSPDQAFYVKCDAETNPRELIDLGQVNIEIGIAPVKPAEFVVFRIAQYSPE